MSLPFIVTLSTVLLKGNTENTSSRVISPTIKSDLDVSMKLMQDPGHVNLRFQNRIELNMESRKNLNKLEANHS